MVLVEGEVELLAVLRVESGRQPGWVSTDERRPGIRGRLSTTLSKRVEKESCDDGQRTV